MGFRFPSRGQYCARVHLSNSEFVRYVAPSEVGIWKLIGVVALYPGVWWILKLSTLPALSGGLFTTKSLFFLLLNWLYLIHQSTYFLTLWNFYCFQNTLKSAITILTLLIYLYLYKILSMEFGDHGHWSWLGNKFILYLFLLFTLTLLLLTILEPSLMP